MKLKFAKSDNLEIAQTEFRESQNFRIILGLKFFANDPTNITGVAQSNRA